MYSATVVKHRDLYASYCTCAISSMANHKIKTECAFHNVDTSEAHRFVEGALHFSSGLVAAGVNNASMRMTTFAR